MLAKVNKSFLILGGELYGDFRGSILDSTGRHIPNKPAYADSDIDTIYLHEQRKKITPPSLYSVGGGVHGAVIYPKTLAHLNIKWARVFYVLNFPPGFTLCP